MSSACKEEQLMEMEALESLFPVEFERLSDSECRLSLVPFSDHSQVNHVSAVLFFRFPETYPLEGPLEYVIERTTGCIATDSSRLEEFDDLISSVRDENFGCCCVYQIAERIQEWLRENNEEEKSLHDMLQNTGKVVKKKPQRTVAESDSDYDEDEDSDYDFSDDDSDEFDSDDYEDEDSEPEYKELEQKVLCPENERVTKEEFQAWKLAEYDLYLLKSELIKRVADWDTRKTGKQQFLETLVRREGKTESATTAAVPESLEFNEDLFDGEDDVDFDDE